MAIPIEEAIDIQKREKIKGSKFKCCNTAIISTCKMCYAIHSLCERESIMSFRPVEKRRRCSICYHKRETEICETCSDTEKKKYYLEYLNK